MKNIWVCGASGMLGSYFTRLLAQRQIPFVSSSREEVDITDLDKISEFVRTQKITHIINCAAYTEVDKAEEEQKEAYLVNAVGPHYLGVAARRHGARILHFSTDYVFDGRGRTPYSEERYCTPIGAYGMSKLAGEIKLLEEHHQACIIRTSWLFGSSGKNFVDTIIRLMGQQETLRVVSDQMGRPTYCLDLATMGLEVLDESGIFHFANTFETSWFEFAQEIHRQAQALGFPLKVKTFEPVSSRDYPAAAKRPAYSTLSTKKWEEYCGHPPRPWQEALRDCLLELQSKNLSSPS